jgi:hypothetical protein
MIVLTNENKTVLIEDNKSGSDVLFEYRDPSTEEEIQYTNEQVKRRGQNTSFEVAEARLKYGSKVLTGIREGDFGQVKDGKVVPLSSDPNSSHYHPNWKKLVKKHARHLIMLLAMHVFEAPGRIVGSVKNDDDDEDADNENENSDDDV